MRGGGLLRRWLKLFWRRASVAAAQDSQQVQVGSNHPCKTRLIPFSRISEQASPETSPPLLCARRRRMAEVKPPSHGSPTATMGGCFVNVHSCRGPSTRRHGEAGPRTLSGAPLSLVAALSGHKPFAALQHSRESPLERSHVRIFTLSCSAGRVSTSGANSGSRCASARTRSRVASWAGRVASSSVMPSGVSSV